MPDRAAKPENYGPHGLHVISGGVQIRGYLVSVNHESNPMVAYRFET